MLGKELDLAVTHQLMMMSSKLRESDDGEYYIHDFMPTDQTESTRMFNKLMMALATNYPEFLFEQRMSLRPRERGVLIVWRRKYRQVRDEPVRREELEADK